MTDTDLKARMAQTAEMTQRVHLALTAHRLQGILLNYRKEQESEEFPHGLVSILLCQYKGSRTSLPRLRMSSARHQTVRLEQ